MLDAWKNDRSALASSIKHPASSLNGLRIHCAESNYNITGTNVQHSER
jgi:hypothetical protein